MGQVVIVGASRGIGLALAREYASAGARVTATSRNRTDLLDDCGATQIHGIDVRDIKSLRDLADQIEGPVDVLIVCAGVLTRESLDDMDASRIMDQFAINAVGPMQVVASLRGALTVGSKVAIVTSRMGSIADNSSGGMYGYRMSKAAVNAGGKSLAIDLKPDGISVMLVHPGYVRTDMTGGNGFISAEESARGIWERVAALSLEQTGTFWHQDGSPLPW